MRKQNIEKLILEYVENNIVDDIKTEFINAAVHFIINEDNCSKYDIMRIKYRFNKLDSKEVVDFLKLSATYGYIIYRSLIFNLVEDNDVNKCCEAIINISNEMTKFVTMENNEADLYISIKTAIDKLNINSKCNDLVLSKLSNVSISF